MTEHHLAPRYVAPYPVSGASGLHILVRMWRLSRLPASDAPLHAFLLNHADVLLVLGSGPVIVKIVILLQGAPNHPTAAGAFLGMEKVLKELRIDSAGDEMYGSVTVELHDTGGNVVFSVPGTLRAIR